MRKQQNVKAHIKESTGTAVDVYTREVYDAGLSANESGRVGLLRQATQGLGDKGGSGVAYPNPGIVSANKMTFGEKVSRWFPSAKKYVDPDGNGVLEFTSVRKNSFTKVVKVKRSVYVKKPDGKLWKRTEWHPNHGRVKIGNFDLAKRRWIPCSDYNVLDLRGVDPKKKMWVSPTLSNIDFSVSNFDNVQIRPRQAGVPGRDSPDMIPHYTRVFNRGVEVHNVKFDGSSCRGLKAEKLTLSGKVSFRGCDMEGAEIKDALLCRDAVLDLRDTNVTAEQLDQIAQGRPGSEHDPTARVLFPSYSMEEAAEKQGLDFESFCVTVALGSHDVRNRFGGVIDPSKESITGARVAVWDID